MSIKCSLCTSEQIVPLFTSKNVHGRHKLSDEKFNIFECSKCKVTFTDVKVNGAYYSKYYIKDYYDQSQKNFLAQKLIDFLETVSFKRKLRLIKKYKPIGSKILEIGCGQGKFLERLPSYFDKYGVEINREGFLAVRENFKDISIYNSPIGENGLDESTHQFDIIIMWQSLEHINQPKYFLKNLTKLLAKEGVIIFEIPNRDSLGFMLTKQEWFHIDTPRHLFHYNYNCLTSLLQNTGLKIIKYSGNTIDFLHDLAFSCYKKFAGKNLIINIFLGLLIIPTGLLVRFIASTLAISYAEVNTYVVKHSS